MGNCRSYTQLADGKNLFSPSARTLLLEAVTGPPCDRQAASHANRRVSTDFHECGPAYLPTCLHCIYTSKSQQSHSQRDASVIPAIGQEIHWLASWMALIAVWVQLAPFHGTAVPLCSQPPMDHGLRWGLRWGRTDVREARIQA